MPNSPPSLLGAARRSPNDRPYGGEDVSVRRCHEGRAGVAEQLCDFVERSAPSEQDRGERVPQVVESDAPQACTPEERVKLPLQIAGVDGRPDAGREAQPRLVPCVTGHAAVQFLPRPVRAHRRNYDLRHSQRGGTAFGLRLSQHEAPTDTLERMADVDHTPVDINIGPRQAERFALSEAHRQRRRPQRGEPIIPRRVEQSPRLIFGEYGELVQVGAGAGQGQAH